MAKYADITQDIYLVDLRSIPRDLHLVITRDFGGRRGDRMRVTNFRIRVEGGKSHPYIEDAERRHAVFAQLRIVLDDPVEFDHLLSPLHNACQRAILLEAAISQRLKTPRQLEPATEGTATLAKDLNEVIRELMVVKAVLDHLVPKEEA